MTITLQTIELVVGDKILEIEPEIFNKSMFKRVLLKPRKQIVKENESKQRNMIH